jgi:SAM-dependent methyltransferase
MLHHVIDWPEALDEVARVLRPGGVFVGYDLTNTMLARLIHQADRSPYRLLAVEELRDGLEAVGFEDVTIRTSCRNHVMRFLARPDVSADERAIRTTHVGLVVLPAGAVVLLGRVLALRWRVAVAMAHATALIHPAHHEQHQRQRPAPMSARSSILLPWRTTSTWPTGSARPSRGSPA